MEYECINCERLVDDKHPLNKIPSKRRLCFKCADKEPERSYMVTEGTGSSKGYASWIKHGHKDPDSYGKNYLINYYTNFNQRFQRIGGSKK